MAETTAAGTGTTRNRVRPEGGAGTTSAEGIGGTRRAGPEVRPRDDLPWITMKGRESEKETEIGDAGRTTRGGIDLVGLRGDEAEW